AAVGLHPQPLAMTGIAFSTYVVFRVALAPWPARRERAREGAIGSAHPELIEGSTPLQSSDAWFDRLTTSGSDARRRRRRRLPQWIAEPGRRLALIAWTGLSVSGLGLALASIQLLPLAEIGAATY